MKMYKWKGLFDHMPARYTRENSPEDIAKHIELHLTLEKTPAVVQISPTDDERTRTITICAKDQPGLFCKIAGAFTLYGLDIQEARIYTWTNGTALDVFKVHLPVECFLDKNFDEKIEQGVLEVLLNQVSLGQALDEKFTREGPMETSDYAIKPKVTVDNNGSNYFTIVAVSAPDSQGLLYRLTKALYRLRINICTARIRTFGYQAMDVFFIQGEDGERILESSRITSIKSALEGVLAIASDQMTH